MVDKVKGGVKRGCVHFDTPSSTLVCYEKFERIETSQPRFVLLKMIIL